MEKWAQAFAGLCPEINDLLKAEIDAGNKINKIYQAGKEEMGGWIKPGTIIVYMEYKFFTDSWSLPAQISAGGPDYQCGIYSFYQCDLHDHKLMESRIS